jgi:hypothetical protein
MTQMAARTGQFESFFYLLERYAKFYKKACSTAIPNG